MAKLNVTFDGITDTTGYLFSLAKCVAAVLKTNSISFIQPPPIHVNPQPPRFTPIFPHLVIVVVEFFVKVW